MIEAGILTAIAERVAAAAGPERPAHPLLVDGWTFGFVNAERFARLCAFDAVFVRMDDGLALQPRGATARTTAMALVARTLAAEGALTAWRDEHYAVAPAFGSSPCFLVERAAARYLGIETYAAHANGLVGRGASSRMWLARRSLAKAIDPGLLDNLVGGGIAAGETPRATLVREAWEEAGIAAHVAQGAQEAGELRVTRIVPDGYQRETIYTYDLSLAEDFRPVSRDGEAIEHRLLDLAQVARLLARTSGPDVVTLDASCVAFACLQRLAASG